MREYLKSSIILFYLHAPGYPSLSFISICTAVPQPLRFQWVKRWHTFAATRTRSSDYQLTSSQHGRQMNPKHFPDIFLPCRSVRARGCRCPFRSNGPSIQAFNWVSFICLQWPLLFLISPLLFLSLIYFFVPHLFQRPHFPSHSKLYSF